MTDGTRLGRSDVVCVLIALLMLGSVLFPALAKSASDASQSSCLKRLAELAIGMQDHHDTRKNFPLASTQPIDHKPGSTEAATAAGFSWLVQLLPFVEQRPLYDRIAPAIKAQTPALDSKLAGSVVLNAFICPGYRADYHVAANDSDYKPLNNGELPALSNYQAIAGTHFENAEGLGRLNPPDKLDRAYEGNGAMPFPGIANGKLQKVGLGMQSIVDGTSHTVMIAETIEPAYSAWIDGQVTWLIAAWPGNPKSPTAEPVPSNDQGLTSLRWSDEDKKSARVAVNLRNADGSPITYLPVGRWSGSKERRFAASSSHPGLVGHAYADGHAEFISTDVDPNIYLHLVTRAGREVIPDDFKTQQMKQRIAAAKAAGADAPEAVTMLLGAPLQVVSEQWEPIFKWSPLAIGDIRISLPAALSGIGFVAEPGDPSILKFIGRSKVFDSILYDREKSEFHLLVFDKEAKSAMSRLYKQLRSALGEPTSKEIDKHPKRITWLQKDSFDGKVMSFEFVLTESTPNDPASVVIRIK